MQEETWLKEHNAKEQEMETPGENKSAVEVVKVDDVEVVKDLKVEKLVADGVASATTPTGGMRSPPKKESNTEVDIFMERLSGLAGFAKKEQRQIYPNMSVAQIAQAQALLAEMAGAMNSQLGRFG